MRTTKSARPGSVVYVPMDKSEFRSIIFSEKKKNKIKKIVILIILMIFVIGCCMYAGISYYYSYHFFYGTTINGIDSSNKTAYEVEQEIAGKKDNYTIQVRARMQDPQAITGKDIDYKYVSSGAVLQLLKTQKSWEWIGSLFETKNYMVQEETFFSREKLEEQVNSLNCAKKENQIAPENAYVSFVNSEFTIVPETEGNELNTKEAYQMICRAIDNDAAEVNLESDPKAYKKADVTKESSELQNMVNTYKNLTKANITYTFGDETVTLDENTIKNWRSPKTNAARIKTSATGAAVLNNPVHILIQALCIAVCHPTDIVCHQKQAEIQLLCLALSFCLITVSLFIVI